VAAATAPGTVAILDGGQMITSSITREAVQDLQNLPEEPAGERTVEDRARGLEGFVLLVHPRRRVDHYIDHETRCCGGISVAPCPDDRQLRPTSWR
jgi:hypothetical protein